MKPPAAVTRFETIEDVQTGLRETRYVAGRDLATSLFLCLKLEKPLFLEGEAGVGKTELAKVLAALLPARLIRLQCYEGLDINNAVYEWNYTRQLLQIRLLEASGEIAAETAAKSIFGPDYLLKRPLLDALGEPGEGPRVLLIDELDRADEEFEAFLLEVLSDFQITIPELGTVRARTPPVVIITSNRTREIHDALKRRCLYFWIDYPSPEKEREIILSKVPDAGERLASDVVSFVQELRREELYKRPGVAETLDWVKSLLVLNERTLSAGVIESTLGVLLKYQDDIDLIKGPAARRILSHAAIDRV